MSKKSLEDGLQKMVAIAANYRLKLEYTLTEYPKVRIPKKYSQLSQGYSYSKCPRCHQNAQTWYWIPDDDDDDPDRPYVVRHKYLCGVCGERWSNTTISD
jgi:hypothetical protein